MRAKTLRTAAALLVVLGLLAAAAPAAAAPDGGPARGDGGFGPALLQHVTAWLAGLWPGAGPEADNGPTALVQRLGSVGDPDGEPAAAQPGPATPSGDGPTADPELGSGANPDG